MLASFFFPGPGQLIIVAMIVLILFGKRLPDLMQHMQSRLVQPHRPRRRQDEKHQPARITFGDLLQVFAATVLVLAMNFALSPELALGFSVLLAAIVLSRL